MNDENRFRNRNRTLIEIRDRLKSGQKTNTSGVVFNVEEGSDRYTFVIGKEMVNELLNLYK